MESKKLLVWNILFFLILIVFMSIHYYRHYINLKREVLSFVKNEAESIAKRFEISATKLYYSNTFLKSIIKNNLESQAKFIDLLNSIEKFQKDELSEFAIETNLNIISLIPFNKGKAITYSNVFFKLPDKLTDKKLVFDKKNKIIYLIYKGRYSKYYVITGIFAKKYFIASKKFTIENLIKSIIHHRKEVIDIKIEHGTVTPISVKLENNKYFVVKLPFEGVKGKIIKITIDASHGVRIIKNFKHNLSVFLITIFSIGFLMNFLIFFLQKSYFLSIKNYEKKLYEQEKDAALGRSSALIAHEIRNPINAVSMGIQRIQYETNISDNEEYSKLIEIMKNELEKVNKSIENFIDYTKPLELKTEKIMLKPLVYELLQPFKKEKIDVSVQIPDDYNVIADKKFMVQALVNLIKNAYENKKTTYLKIYAADNKIIFENDGLEPGIDCDKIFEPYYSRKTKGSGLGLAILKKISDAHHWKLRCNIRSNIIKFEINFII